MIPQPPQPSTSHNTLYRPPIVAYYSLIVVWTLFGIPEARRFPFRFCVPQLIVECGGSAADVTRSFDPDASPAAGQFSVKFRDSGFTITRKSSSALLRRNGFRFCGFTLVCYSFHCDYLSVEMREYLDAVGWFEEPRQVVYLIFMFPLIPIRDLFVHHD